MIKDEVRTFQCSIDMEERADGKGFMLKGIGLPYNQFDGNTEVFREKFLPGAFRDHLRTSPDVFSFFNHDRSKVLGRTLNGTLRIEDREDGLYYEVDLPNTTVAKDLYENVKRRDVTGTSIAFRTLEDEWGTDEQGDWRVVKKGELTQVSPETTPWYKNTDVAVRSLESFKDEKRKTEDEKTKNESAVGASRRMRELELLELEHNGKTR